MSKTFVGTFEGPQGHGSDAQPGFRLHSSPLSCERGDSDPVREFRFANGTRNKALME